MKKLIFLFVLVSCILGCKEENPYRPESFNTTVDNNIISIKEQGAFAIGGTIKTSEGTFDPIAHGGI